MNDANIQHKILAIGGGKGGIGKSIISANLAVSLALSGSKVILIDADLGGANLNSLFGIKYIQNSLEDYLGSRKKVKEFLTDTKIPNLKLLLGGTPFLGIANPKHSQKLKLIKAINELEADYIMVDLGAGTSFTVLDFFNLADFKIVVLSPDITSLQNCYSFVKLALFRYYQNFMSTIRADKLFTESEFKKLSQTENNDDLFNLVKAKNENLHKILLESRKIFNLNIIGNMVSKDKDINILKGVSNIINNYLKISPHTLGYITKSNFITESVNQMKPFFIDGKDVVNIGNVSKIRNYIVNTDFNLLNIRKQSLKKLTEDFHRKGNFEEIQATLSNEDETSNPEVSAYSDIIQNIASLNCMIPAKIKAGNNNFNCKVINISDKNALLSDFGQAEEMKIIKEEKQRTIFIPVLDEGMINLPFYISEETGNNGDLKIIFPELSSDFHISGLSKILSSLILNQKL